jgi:hypothetical protein
MKADVFPVLPGLGIPSWVPEPIAQCARTKHAAAVDWVYEGALKESGYFDDYFDMPFDDVPREWIDELIRDDVARANVADQIGDELADITAQYLPLACDPRMKQVWRELSRQSNGAFLNPARVASQDAAMLEVFKVALACQQERGSTMTRGELEQRRDRYLAKAAELRDDAFTMLGGNDGMKRLLKLCDVARVYEDRANEINAASIKTSLKRKHDGQGRWVAVAISDTFCRLFGSPMYGLTATITSVILGRDIDSSTVRYWCDKPPHSAVKPPKISR